MAKEPKFVLGESLPEGSHCIASGVRIGVGAWVPPLPSLTDAYLSIELGGHS